MRQTVYSWLRMIELVSEYTKESWSRIWEYRIMEFFNYYSYCLARNKEKYNQMKMGNGGHR